VEEKVRIIFTHVAFKVFLEFGEKLSRNETLGDEKFFFLKFFSDCQQSYAGMPDFS
jgi:hypothetical protein